MKQASMLDFVNAGLLSHTIFIVAGRFLRV